MNIQEIGMKKKILFVVIAAALLLAVVLTGFTRLKIDTQNGLTVVNPVVTLGGDPPVQKITYSLTLHNGNSTDIQVDWVKPVTGSAFKAMLGSKPKLTQEISKVIPAGEDLEITGQFQIKTNGIPMDELEKMGDLVKSFQVSSRQSFPAPTIVTAAAKKVKSKTGATPEPKANAKAKKTKATATPKP